METAKWQSIKGVMSAVLDLPMSERAAALEREPDAEIRREVGMLLAAHESSESFIEQPFLIEQGIAPDETADKMIGRQIEDYLIIDRIGSGGMGAVFLAQRIHSDFTQKVALKLIKRGMDSEAILKRFATERRILSTLKHPNIAALVDGGISTEGLPFFVMEYVDGKPLNQYCRENDLSLDERLELFYKICSAVEHAHRNLIVHRDLKPSNILVAEDGTPKLLDFGIAKLLSDDGSATAETLTQGKIFTPEYASPEQILGKPVTTSTDVYSLGVILYELLVDHRPFDVKGKSFDEIVEGICRTESPRPSDTADQPHVTADDAPPLRPIPPAHLRGDIDNIVLKALRKAPAERYGSVQEFSADISRYLSGMTVMARPQTLKYRFGKYVNRHKAGVFAASLVLISLVAGASVATWQAIVAKRERAKAEQRFIEVRELVDTILFDHYERIKTLPGATGAREKLVTDALQYLDKLAADSSNDTELQRDLVAGYHRLAAIQGSSSFGGNNGQLNAAAENYLKALAIQEKLAASPIATIDDRRNLGKLYQDISLELDEQLDLQTRADYAEKALDIFRGLAEKDPNRQQLGDLANSLWSWAQTVRLKGDNSKAIEIFEQAAALYEQLASEDVANHKPRRNAALTYKNIGSLYFVDGNYQKALEYYQKALASDLQTSAAAPGNIEMQMDLSFAYVGIANAQNELGDKDGTYAAFQSAQDLQRRVIDADPKNKFAYNALFRTYASTAGAYFRFEDLARSAAFYAKCGEMLAAKAGEEESSSDKVDRAMYLWGYGKLLAKQADLELLAVNKLAAYRKARSQLTEAADIYRKMQEQTTLDPAYIKNPAQIAASLDRVDQAIASLR